jgi:hypothetical protein
VSERWFRYLHWADWPRWAAIGWVFSAELGPPHGFYSGLWEWGGDGPPRAPGREDEAMSRRSEAERLERERRADHAIAGKSGAAHAPAAEVARNFDLCIYHEDCADGFTAAWAVAQRLPGIECVPARYGSLPPALRGRRIVLVDFSYEPETLERLAGENFALLVIDHHASAIRRLRERTPPAGARGPDLLLDEGHSGAMLAWRFFNGGAEPPALIRYVEDRDLWRFELPRSRAINALIGATEFCLEEWSRLAARLDDAAGFEAAGVAGEALLSARRKDVDEVLRRTARIMRIGGVAVPVCNAPKHLASDIGNLLARDVAAQALAPEISFAAVYFDRADGRREFSLRSEAGRGADVAAIADRYGGGGHRHAAGFIAPPGWEGDAPPAPSRE